MPARKYQLKNTTYRQPLSIILLHAAIKNNLKRFGPAALYKVGDTTLLQHQLHILRSIFPLGDFIVISGENIDKFSELDIGVRLIQNEDAQNTGGAWSALMGIRATMASQALIINGNNFFAADLFNTLPDQSCLLYNNDAVDIGIVFDKYVENIFYGLGKNWCECVLLKKKELDAFRRLKFERELLLFEVLNQLIYSGEKFVAHETEAKILNIKTATDIKNIRIQN